METFPKDVSSVLDDATIGAYLKKYRRESARTAQEVADVFGLSSQAIYNIESGRNHIDDGRLLRMLDMYGVDVDEAFRGELSTCREKAVLSRRERRMAEGFAELSDAGKRFMLDALEMALKAEGRDGDGTPS